MATCGRDGKLMEANSNIVHSEPGEDKRTFANDVADWVLARASMAREQTSGDPPAKSKL